MTKLALDDFNEFFAAAHDGARPFPWQLRLVEQLLVTGCWPNQIAAPTGAGKTAVIDAHVFAVAAMADGAGAVVPRRLALVVPRRVLVDSQYDHACDLARLLGRHPASQATAVRRVAGALLSLRWGQAPAQQESRVSPLVVARLRGGLPPPRAWRDDPVACAVLSCTPDMWGSRLLLRAYGSSPRAWPREAGLVAMDAVVVVDEAHLCRQLLTSARSVADLQESVGERLNVPSLQVVEATATPTASARSVLEVGTEDLAEPVLATRLLTPKPVEILRLADWPAAPKGAARDRLARRMADEVVSLRQRYGPTVGVFVNTVRMATDVAAELQAIELEGRKLNTVLVCGRLRDHDVEQLRIDHPGLLSVVGNEDVDVLVATQSLEVGVDLDLSAALSELAPGGAIAQRAGRVNRLGRRTATRLVVVGPKDASPFEPGAVPGIKRPGEWGPYDADELGQGLAWLERRASDPEGLSPSALALHSPPPATARRTLYQRVELADSWWWARSSDDLDPDPELDLWLADSLEAVEAESGVIVRHALPVDQDQAVALLRALPPRAHEVFPTSLVEVRQILERALQSETGWGTVLVVRGEEVSAVADGHALRIRPGDILVLDDCAAAFTSGVVRPDGQEKMPDVLEAKSSPGPGDVVLRVDEATWPDEAGEVLRRCAALLAEGSTTRRVRDALADLLGSAAVGGPMTRQAAGLLRGRLKDCDVVAFYEQDLLVRLVVVDQRSAVSDDAARQTWTRASDPVLLEQHAQAVSKRARCVAERVGLGPEMASLLALAGRHHDDGKADLRFQVVLGRSGDGPLLAKGLQISSARDRPASALPARWRHEQVSVLEAWEDLASLAPHDRELVARLVGTSHGHGRVGFPHASAELGTADEHQALAARLFDEGCWDEIIERTDRRLGVWACAFLEAVLRAADGQVSGEGS